MPVPLSGLRSTGQARASRGSVFVANVPIMPPAVTDLPASRPNAKVRSRGKDVRARNLRTCTKCKKQDCPAKNGRGQRVCEGACPYCRSKECDGPHTHKGQVHPDNATGHLNKHPRFECSCYTCTSGLVTDDPKAIAALKHEDNWWSTTFVQAFATMISHHERRCQTREGVKLVYRFGGSQETWSITGDSLDGVTKVIVLELANSHYTMTTFEKTAEGARVGHLDGFQKEFREGNSVANTWRQATIEDFLHISQWGPLCEGVVTGSYLQQTDGSSCGPILVLALYDQMMGERFPGLDLRRGYTSELRPLLVDWYVDRFRETREERAAARGNRVRAAAQEQGVYVHDSDSE